MQRVKQLGYAGFGVSDRAAWQRFATDILGLQRVAEDSDVTYDRYRMDEYRARVIVYEDSLDDIAFAGWELNSARDLEAMAAQLEAAGIEVKVEPQELAENRRVSALMSFSDPDGFRHEIYHGAQIAFEKPFQSPRPLSGFLTGDQGIGHIVLGVQNLDASMRFYCDALGMRESDYITISRGDSSFDIGFLHCNPRHHTVALAAVNRPKRCMHLMVQVNSLDDVGSTYYLCQEHQVPIAASMGRHTNDHMVSFYVKSPSDFEIEYGWGARVIDDDTWKVQRHHAPSIWGHQR